MASRRSSRRSGRGSRSSPARRAPAASRARNGRRRSRRWSETPQGRDALGLALIAAALFLGGIFLLDWEGGLFGSSVHHMLLLAIGHAAFVFPFIMVVLGTLVMLRSEVIDLRQFQAGVTLLVPTVLLIFGSDRFGIGDGTARQAGFDADRVVEHGGYVGAALYYASYQLFADVGTTILCVLCLAMSTLFITGSSVQAIGRWWARRIGAAAVSATHTSRAAASRLNTATADQRAAARRTLSGESRDPDWVFNAAERFPDIFGDIPERFTAQVVDVPDSPLEEQARDKKSKRTSKKDAAAADGEDQLALLALEPHPDEQPPSEVVAEPEMEARVASRRRRYRLPTKTLLTTTPASQQAGPENVETIKRLLVDTFSHFGIAARVTGVVPGPRVSRYELSLAPGTKMSKVEGLRKDLAYALATTEIRILAPIPGKSAVGIEVENARPSMVTLGDIVGGRPKGKSPLHVWFGKDISGKTIGADLADMPHLLVAGTTGAGKSGCMNVMLSSILLSASPDEVRMLLIDPKKVELSTYEGIPHLLTPVVTNMKKASNALGNVIAQMEERYSSMDLAGTRTLREYNRVRVQRGQEPEPYVLIVIDELADLVMIAKRDVEDAVIRLAQKGRAAGFHLVLATQRPSVDVITGMIKSNVPSRIAFAVSSQTDSRVILDQGGAETLLGRGDMLFKPVWARAPHRVQGAWVTEAEVRALCDASRQEREPEYDIDLLKEPEDTGEDTAGLVDDDRLAEAVRLVAEFQTCSASFFQRKMRVGFTRGARLVDIMERLDLVAPSAGTKPRDVLFTMEDLPRILSEIEDAETVAASAHDV